MEGELEKAVKSLDTSIQVSRAILKSHLDKQAEQLEVQAWKIGRMRFLLEQRQTNCKQLLKEFEKDYSNSF